MLEAVIFDFDGLILETETPEVRSWERVFGHHGVEYPESYWRFTLGRGAEQVRERPYDLLVAAGVEANEAEVLDMREGLLAQMLAELHVMPGVLERIAQARSLGLRLGIASSSRHSWVDRHLSDHGLLDQFDSVVCADDVERAKPFPDLYLECCRRLRADPSRCLALEDSENGARAAKAAGLAVVAVPTLLTRREDLDADLVLASLRDLDLAGFAAVP